MFVAHKGAPPTMSVAMFQGPAVADVGCWKGEGAWYPTTT